MALDDNVKKEYDKLKLKDFGLEQSFSQGSLPRKAADLSGISGVIAYPRDFYVNFYKSLFKDKPKAEWLKNWALQWGSGIASYTFGYQPMIDYLKGTLSDIVGHSVMNYGGSEVLGGSLGSALAGLAPYVLTTPLGIGAMYYGLRKENPFLVGGGAAWAFGSATAGYDIFSYFASLFAPLSTAPVLPVVASVLTVGLIYRLGQYLMRPLAKKFFGGEKTSEKKPDIYPMPQPTPEIPTPETPYREAA